MEVMFITSRWSHLRNSHLLSAIYIPDSRIIEGFFFFFFFLILSDNEVRKFYCEEANGDRT